MPDLTSTQRQMHCGQGEVPHLAGAIGVPGNILRAAPGRTGVVQLRDRARARRLRAVIQVLPCMRSAH